MGWGLDLWDREAEVKTHLEDGLKFIDKSRAFVTEMSKLEASFAAQMKKLVKQYMPVSADDAYSQDAAYRVCPLCFWLCDVVQVIISFQPMQALMKTCEFLADQHQQVANALLDDVAEPLKNLQKDKENARTLVYAEMARQTNAHERELETLSKVVLVPS